MPSPVPDTDASDADRPTGEGAPRHVVPISGMTCASCERRVGRALQALPGVQGVVVSAPRGHAVLRGELPPDDVLHAAIRRAGYTPGAPAWITRDRRSWLVAAVGALVLAGAAVLISVLGWSVPAPDAAAPGLLLALLVGLAAGVSTCMALIGGLVLGVSAAGAASGSGAGRVRAQLRFQAGRWLGFAVGGAVLGTLGRAARLPDPAIAGGALVAAAVMILLGARLSGLSPRISGWRISLPARWGARFGGPAPAGSRWGQVVLGAATFLLPCGFTQAMQLYAMSLGSPGAAAAVMVMFAIGTTPGLLGLGTLAGWASRRGSATALQLVGVLVVGFAVITGGGGLRALGVQVPTLAGWASAPAALPDHVSANVRWDGGVQVVSMTQSADGYQPADTTVWAGTPIRWEVTVTSGLTCTSAIRIPSVAVKADLFTTGLHAVPVPALPVGVTSFSCVMGMYGGHFTAIPRPATTP